MEARSLSTIKLANQGNANFCAGSQVAHLFSLGEQFLCKAAATLLYPCFGEAYRLGPLQLEAESGIEHPLQFPQVFWCIAHRAGR